MRLSTKVVTGRGSGHELFDGLEMLEQRLASAPGADGHRPPSHALSRELERLRGADPDHRGPDRRGVVRFAGPDDVQNFMKYITTGKLDESFFHRLMANYIQGGTFKYDDIAHLSAIPPEASIPTGFSRSNLARTLASCPTVPPPPPASFIINLVDNIGFNTQSGGFTVFGKVVQGWDVVQMIAGLATQDLDLQLTGANPNPGTFDKVPVTAAYNPNTGPTEATLVKIIDVEIIKPPNLNMYYTQQYVFPEGFRSATTTERLDLVNLDLGNANLYQVIVRYESGQRDAVIFTGTLSPGARTSLKVNDKTLPGLNLVRSNVGYSFEVRTTRAMGVSLNHQDNGVTLGEQFLILPRIITPQLNAWNLPGNEKSSLTKNYVIIESLTNAKIVVNMLIFPNGGGTPIFRGMPLEAFRRGGWIIEQIPGVPNGDFSVQISANGPIVASLSHYKTGGGGNASDASSALGLLGGGRGEGYLAGAMIPSGGSASLDVEFTVGSPAAMTINFDFTLSNGTVLAAAPIVLTGANRRVTMNLAAMNANLPTDQFFSIHYIVGNGGDSGCRGVSGGSQRRPDRNAVPDSRELDDGLCGWVHRPGHRGHGDAGDDFGLQPVRKPERVPVQLPVTVPLLGWDDNLRAFGHSKLGSAEAA
jgi:cyclophilin family peptidyl-prolyl cis-trans isomerase